MRRTCARPSPRKQFHLVFQPLINAKTQKLIGFEALIRWNHPQRGFVPPNVFIPVAEETGLMPRIGDWVIDEACRAAATWPELDHASPLNISPKQILLPALPNVVSEALGQLQVPGNRLELEVTEGVFLGDNGKTLDVLKRLRALGVGIALDDFGTGYSSIGYLNKAIFHKLKIDGSFVREAGSRPRERRDHPVDRSARQELPHVGHRRGRRDRRGFRAHARARLRHDPGLSVRQAASYERANQMVLGLGAKRMAS